MVPKWRVTMDTGRNIEFAISNNSVEYAAVTWRSGETSLYVVRPEVFTALTMKNGVFWDVMQCGSCKNRCFGGT
jgi:hypothetical protein